MNTKKTAHLESGECVRIVEPITTDSQTLTLVLV